MDDWEQTFKFMLGSSSADPTKSSGGKLLDQQQQEELFRLQMQKRNALNAASMRFPPMQQQPPPPQMPFGNAGEMSELEYFYLNGGGLGGHLGGLPQPQQQGNMSKFFAFHKNQQSQVRVGTEWGEECGGTN